MQSLIERAVKQAGPEKVLSILDDASFYEWTYWARPEQLAPPGDWLTWLLMAGRGFGKTRAGAEYVRREVENGRSGRVALVGKTPADVRDVMIEGESGILSVSPPWNLPVYESSKRRMTWPNGAIATLYSSFDPDQLRGPQHDLAWADELRTFHNPTETWDNLMFGLRLGLKPRCVVTTTPSPIQVIRDLIKSPDTVIARGSTYDNRANLAKSFYRQIISKYEGTRLGQQEIYAELLDDVPGALWQRSLFKYGPAPELARIVISIDPSVTSKETSDETGIIAVGTDNQDKYWVLSDLSLRASPHKWAEKAISEFHRLKADRVIGETNNGGDMIELTLRTIDSQIPFIAVHASRGKYTRAEPIAALYEQGKVTHVEPFTELEDQCCTWTPEAGKSPDRLDALVWGLTYLSQGGVWRVL